MSSRHTYQGAHRRLVLAFDVGTTFSGISYSILEPGEVPRIMGVNRFPAQENVGGDSKIPSIIYYDRKGAARAVGAEALDPSVAEKVDEEGWQKVEWFKLHLRPKSMGSSLDGTTIPRLPRSKTVVQVFADFLAYLFKCARAYIEETHAAGRLLWQSVEKDIHFVLSHPNGWAGVQQSKMRRSAILGGLIPEDGRSRVQFVTEGEASLHSCIQSGLASSSIKDNSTVIIVDAGGGTIDVSSYNFASVAPLRIEETAVPECWPQGSVLVSRRAHAFLRGLLCGSHYGSPDDVDNIAECFDKTTKRIFRDSADPAFIKFGTPRDKDLKVGIRMGQLKLNGADVAALFEPSITAIVDSVQRQREPDRAVPPVVFLVGGFAASPWLFAQLEDRLSRLGLSLFRPDNHTSKAVADGAVSFYIDHFVSVRTARADVGVRTIRPFNSSDWQHIKRSSTVFTDVDGQRRVPGGFDVILGKGTKVSEAKEFSQPYIRVSDDLRDFDSISVHVTYYKGDGQAPRWTDEDPDMFATLCTVQANTCGRARTFRNMGKLYYRINFSVILIFGLTELTAQISWMENGQEKRGPATIAYEDDMECGAASGDEDEDEEVDEDDEDDAGDGPDISDRMRRIELDKARRYSPGEWEFVV